MHCSLPSSSGLARDPLVDAGRSLRTTPPQLDPLTITSPPATPLRMNALLFMVRRKQISCRPFASSELELAPWSRTAASRIAECASNDRDLAQGVREVDPPRPCRVTRSGSGEVEGPGARTAHCRAERRRSASQDRLELVGAAQDRHFRHA